MWYSWEKREIHTGFFFENLKEKVSLKYLGMDGWIILKWIFRK
jgi:hypothetical protein